MIVLILLFKTVLCVNTSNHQAREFQFPQSGFQLPQDFDCLYNLLNDDQIKCDKEYTSHWRNQNKLKKFCCSNWEQLDCLMRSSYSRCEGNEIAMLQSWANKQRRILENEICDYYSYGSFDCLYSCSFNKLLFYNVMIIKLIIIMIINIVIW